MSRSFTLSAQTNVPAFNRALVQYLNLRPRDVEKFLREEMRGLLKLVMRFTPPENRKQGEKALQRDIENSVRPIRLRSYKGRHAWARAMRLAIRNRNKAAAEVLLRRSGDKMRDVQVVDFNQSVHRNARGTRFRVRRWTRKMTLDVEQFDDYADKMRPRVGNARGGWAASIMQLGGRVALWINRHAYAGGMDDQLKNPVEQFITASNSSTWAKGARSGRSVGNVERVLNNALRSRAGVLQRKLARAGEAALGGAR